MCRIDFQMFYARVSIQFMFNYILIKHEILVYGIETSKDYIFIFEMNPVVSLGLHLYLFSCVPCAK
jgi:hypothetical protein